MSFLIVLFGLTLTNGMSVSQSNQCKCSQFISDTVCFEQVSCFWDGSLCQTRTCSDYDFEGKCDAAPTCSWNGSSCSTFTQCSDYYVNDSYDCYKIGNDDLLQQCQPTIDGNSCTDFQYTTCGTTEDQCQGFESYWKICYWFQNSCASVDIRYCDQLLDEELCTIFGVGLGCQWNNIKCAAIQCSDYTTEANCILERQNNVQEDLQLCKWKDTTCELASDTSHLDYSNCFTNSFQNYIWDTDKKVCVSCKTYVPTTKTSP